MSTPAIVLIAFCMFSVAVLLYYAVPEAVMVRIRSAAYNWPKAGYTSTKKALERLRRLLKPSREHHQVSKIKESAPPAPPPPRPTTEQTRQAQRLLSNADEIYRKALGLSDHHQSKIGPYFEQYRETLKLLDLAAHDTVRARNLDPGARVPVKDGTGRVFQCDSDWMAGRLLRHEAVLSISTNQSETTIRDGIACLRKYLVYRPYDADGYRLLAIAYTRVFERQNALEAIKKAAELSPDDVEVRLVHDKLNNPEIGTPEPSKLPGQLLWSACPLLVLAGIVMLFTPLAPVGVFLAAGGGILWFVRNRSDDNKIYADAFNEAAGIKPPKRTL
jgi:tetratricopeptide (TPR) repeat protein